MHTVYILKKPCDNSLSNQDVTLKKCSCMLCQVNIKNQAKAQFFNAQITF